MDASTQKRPRDLRLDFFRGLAMFIILTAHIPDNKWTLWIPARFGFSDATEMFVFLSGMASAIAFGAVFAERGWLLGTARVVYRIWQVYWAQIGMVLATAVLLYAIDSEGWGLPGKSYLQTLPIVPLFDDTGAALLGLATLGWVPNYFDILPMYLVILAMIPLVAGIHRVAGREAAIALVLGIWFAAQLGLLELPSRPWDATIPWFFNPFGWQLVFFTGFAFGMGWLPAPPVRRWLVVLAAAYVVLVIPFAWFRIHEGFWLPADWALREWIAAVRAETEFLWWKSWVGAARYLHFLALAYLAWVAVGPGGIRLRTGWAAPGGASRSWQWAAAAVALATVPWAWAKEIGIFLPGLDAFILHHFTVTAEAWLGTDLLLPAERIGMLQVVHLAALVVLGWSALGPRRRDRVLRDGFLALLPFIRKVGQQSLAVFVFSMAFAQVLGLVLDHLGRAMWSFALVNLAGYAVLVGLAWGVGWFRAQPWRRQAPATAGRPAYASGLAPAE